VKTLSPLLEVPAQLALVLTLAASGPGEGVPIAPPAETAAIGSTQLRLTPEPLEGPYRFSETSWLRALREDLPASDPLAAYSGRIFKTSGGRYYVPDAADRGAILASRTNTALAARVAEIFAARNAARLRVGLRRPLSGGDLFIAHMFGSEAAIAFIRQTEAHPNDPAAQSAPDLVPAAPEPETGAPPLTLAQLYNRLTEPMRRFVRSAAAREALSARTREQEAALSLKSTIGESSLVAGVSAAASSIVWRTEADAAGTAASPQ
jgi:hypothetical protein